MTNELGESGGIESEDEKIHDVGGVEPQGLFGDEFAK